MTMQRLSRTKAPVPLIGEILAARPVRTTAGAAFSLARTDMALTHAGPATVQREEAEMTRSSRLEQPSVPVEASQTMPARQDASREGAVLAAAGIVTSYRRNLWLPRYLVRVLTGAETSLEQGEVVGLVGERGSGKSTLMRILVGDLS